MIRWPEEFLKVDPLEITKTNGFSSSLFRKYGVQILPGFLTEKECSEIFQGMQESTKRDFHPVAWEFSEARQIDSISTTVRKRISDNFQELLGRNIGLMGARFLRKSPGQEGLVSLHQDIGYHIGTFDQVSVFVALSDVNATNGAIRFVPGSHHLGYLGDAGALEKFHPDSAEICPELSSGDCVVMHCATIHHSPPNLSEAYRDLFEIILCPSEQPWRIDNLLAGKSDPDRYFGSVHPGSVTLFRSGRSQRLAQIRRILDQK